MPQTCCSTASHKSVILAGWLAGWLAGETLWMHLQTQTLHMLQQQLHDSPHRSARGIKSTYLESLTSSFQRSP